MAQVDRPPRELDRRPPERPVAGVGGIDPRAASPGRDGHRGRGPPGGHERRAPRWRRRAGRWGLRGADRRVDRRARPPAGARGPAGGRPLRGGGGRPGGPRLKRLVSRAASPRNDPARHQGDGQGGGPLPPRRRASGHPRRRRASRRPSRCRARRAAKNAKRKKKKERTTQAGRHEAGSGRQKSLRLRPPRGPNARVKFSVRTVQGSGARAGERHVRDPAGRGGGLDLVVGLDALQPVPEA